MDKNLGPRLYELLEAHPRDRAVERWFDRFSIGVVILGWLMAALTSVSTIRESTADRLTFAIWVIVGIIVIEYSVRVWASGYNPCERKTARVERLAFAFASVNVLDPICIVLCSYGLLTSQPEFISAGFTLRLLRIFRFTKADDVIWTIIRRNLPQIGTVLVLWAVVVMAGAGFMYAFESKAQPDKFSNLFQCVYYMLVTFTTTGYGDLYPLTPAGKLIAASTMLISMGLLGGIPTGIVAGEFIAVRNAKYADEAGMIPVRPTEESGV
ncbi:MAG: ion transporter [Armatimonadota bacterium]